MKRLLLDFGNSRMKFVLAEGSELGGVSAHSYADVDEALACVGQLPEQVFSDCVAASVKGRGFDDAFAAEFEKRFGFKPRFVSVADNDVLDLAYQDESRFGIDRLLNLLGARALGLDCVLVVSAGTAITFDGMNGERHLGGCIFPGRRLLGDALFGGTSMIKARPGDDVATCFGVSTEEAVTAGVQFGAVGAASFIVSSMLSEMPDDTVVVLTGGDAQLLAKGLSLSFQVESALLFRGLLYLSDLNP